MEMVWDGEIRNKDRIESTVIRHLLSFLAHERLFELRYSMCAYAIKRSVTGLLNHNTVLHFGIKYFNIVSYKVVFKM